MEKASIGPPSGDVEQVTVGPPTRDTLIGPPSGDVEQALVGPPTRDMLIGSPTRDEGGSAGPPTGNVSIGPLTEDVEDGWRQASRRPSDIVGLFLARAESSKNPWSSRIMSKSSSTETPLFPLPTEDEEEQTSAEPPTGKVSIGPPTGTEEEQTSAEPTTGNVSIGPPTDNVETGCTLGTLMLAGLTLATWGAGWMAHWEAGWMLAGLMLANWGAGWKAHWKTGWGSGEFKKSLSQPGNELFNQGLWETSLRAMRRHPSLYSHLSIKLSMNTSQGVN
ncbi:Hypothetical protein SMAX5B_009649 [Scophthalmus maximus]|uniref:Uncharacterized protein n=1 Tax=Scophthalmus maximus TaxID=52904 RepID=A0A2U9C4N3_SCOMX|nr:Hypothetical protein SMAX5B_009649 [Scophthalmus maximus]